MRLARHEWVWVRGRVEMRGALVLIAAVAADFTRDLTIRLDVDYEAIGHEMEREVERRVREFLKSYRVADVTITYAAETPRHEPRSGKLRQVLRSLARHLTGRCGQQVLTIVPGLIPPHRPIVGAIGGCHDQGTGGQGALSGTGVMLAASSSEPPTSLHCSEID